MLYFKQELVSLAYHIIETKETNEHIKAWNYMIEINKVFEQYSQFGNYNSSYVNKLDERIREDYPLIEELELTPSNHSTIQTNSIGKGLPIELNKLDVDRFGILCSVLLKKKIVNALKDFLE